MDKPDSSAAARLVSVVVPTRDRPHQLREALASIRALEGPDLQFEILVGDNGTDSETAGVVEAFGGIHIRSDKVGAAAGRNAGMRQASGEFIAFLDDDDVWLEGNIRPQIAILDARPEIDAVIGRLIPTGPDLKRHEAPRPETDPGEGNSLIRSMLSGYFPQLGATVVRTNVRDVDGYFDEGLTYGQDLDWQLRMARRHAMAFTPTICMLFRGRDAVEFDVMSFKRAQFDRRIFLSHALPEWRVWRSPMEFLRGYSGTMSYFYWHFLYLAGLAAERGDAVMARKTVGGAFYVFPLRATLHAVTRAPFRKAALTMVGLGAKPQASAGA
ncbi:MAG: glycosyltransferase family 2 protein [Hyphomonas sp.]|nr:glycosyltransferase family 2 protein [Hyphomonas sp.]